VIAWVGRCNEASPVKETFPRPAAPVFPAPIFNKRRQAVAVSSIQPDSLRALCLPRREGGRLSGHRVPDGSRAFAETCEGGIRLSMLPGFRFLFVAIVLSMSILVFGLGAAALLRAAHEEFASTPAWHATPETKFAQQSEAARPVLALLRVDAPVEQKASDNNTAPAAQPTAPAVIASTPAEPETSAAPAPDNSSLPEAAKPEIPVAETSPPVAETSPLVEAAPVQAAPASADETTIAAVVVSTDEAAPAAPEQVSVPNSPEADAASTKIATLGGPPVTIEPPAVSANPDKSTVRKRRQAQRAKARRRIAQRARMTARAAQLPADPFAQPTTIVRSR
jgi:hypothetical protein